MDMILRLLSVSAALSSLLLMLVILLQEPKGGGLAAALGGSGMDAIGANVGQVNRFTTWAAGVWIGACLLHALWQPVGVSTAKSTEAGVKAPPTGPNEGGGGGNEPPK